MRFLNARGRVAPHEELDLRPAFGGSAVAAEERDGRQAAGLSLLQRAQDIFRIAAGCDGDEDVAGLTKAGDLAGEDLVVAVIVADRAHEAPTLGEVKRRIGAPIGREATAELGREIGAVRRAPAVAADEKLFSRREAVDHRVNRASDRGGKLLKILQGRTGGLDRFI